MSDGGVVGYRHTDGDIACPWCRWEEEELTHLLPIEAAYMRSNECAGECGRFYSNEEYAPKGWYLEGSLCELPLTNADNAQGCTCSTPTSNRYTLKDRGDGEVAPHCSGCGEELEL